MVGKEDEPLLSYWGSNGNFSGAVLTVKLRGGETSKVLLFDASPLTAATWSPHPLKPRRHVSVFWASPDPVATPQTKGSCHRWDPPGNAGTPFHCDVLYKHRIASPKRRGNSAGVFGSFRQKFVWQTTIKRLSRLVSLEVVFIIHQLQLGLTNA